jgi:hypothetical protein
VLNSLNDKLRLAVTVAQTHHDRFHSLAALFRIVVTAPKAILTLCFGTRVRETRAKSAQRRTIL